jgi:membrane protein YqaA with SNARE-associated domain
MNYVYISLSLKSSSTLIYAVYATLSTLRYELCVYLFGFFTQRNATQRNATQRNATQRTQRNATQRTQRNATQRLSI